MTLPQKLSHPTYPFSEQELLEAYRAWGCNCGPAALAAMLSLKPNNVRGCLPGFDQKRYTNPTMMGEALKRLGVKMEPAGDAQKLTHYGICRIQWEGPWTRPEANPRWAYTRTHWIGAMVHPLQPGWPGESQWVYDVNAGWQTINEWEHTAVPEIISEYKGATGGWWPTHRWELIFT